MAAEADADGGKKCGPMGCKDDAEFVVKHPSMGEIYVCEQHARGFEVVRRA